MKKQDLIKLLEHKDYLFSDKGDVLIIENKGYVDLRSLTTLPEGVKFENKGYVDLRSLTTLPEGVKFENKGYVDLRGLESETLKTFDGATSSVISIKKMTNGVTIYKTQYLGYLSLGNRIRFVAEKDALFSHGETIREALGDLNFKYLQKNSDVSEIVDKIKETQKVTIAQYRLITGACSSGTRDFPKSQNVEVEEMELNKVLELVRGQYGYETFVSHFK